MTPSFARRALVHLCARLLALLLITAVAVAPALAQQNPTNTYDDPVGDLLNRQTLEPWVPGDPANPAEFPQEWLDAVDLTRLTVTHEPEGQLRFRMETRGARPAGIPFIAHVHLSGAREAGQEAGATATAKRNDTDDPIDAASDAFASVFFQDDQPLLMRFGAFNPDTGEFDITEGSTIQGVMFETVGDCVQVIGLAPSLIGENDRFAVSMNVAGQVDPNTIIVVADLQGVRLTEEEDVLRADFVNGLPAPECNLKLEVAVSPELRLEQNQFYQEGQEVVFFVTVTNQGPPVEGALILAGSIVEDKSLELREDASTCTPAPDQLRGGVTCVVGPLGTGDLVTVQIPYRVPKLGDVSSQLIRDLRHILDLWKDEKRLSSEVFTGGVAPSRALLLADAVRGLSQRAARKQTLVDVYLDALRIADDVDIDGPLFLPAAALPSVRPLLSLTAADAEDNSDPLLSLPLDLLPEGAETLSDAYAVILTEDAEGAPTAVVMPDFRTAAADPAQADLAVVHAGAAVAPIDFTTSATTGPVAENMPFGGYAPYVALPSGSVTLRLAAANVAGASLVLDAAPGEAYLGLVRDSPAPPEAPAGKALQHFVFELFRADGTPVETVVATATEDEARAPARFRLHANYPNPFNPATRIGYELAAPARVRLAVYDVTGREVAVLVEAEQPAGRYEAVFGADHLPSGVYAYRLETDALTQTRTMLLIK